MNRDDSPTLFVTGTTGFLGRLRSRGIHQFWHFAASLNFEEKSRKKIWSQNVEGTFDVLDLARRAGIPEFVYCSTACSAGRSVGMVDEELQGKRHPGRCHPRHEGPRHESAFRALTVV